jgi:hypothetical protein
VYSTAQMQVGAPVLEEGPVGEEVMLANRERASDCRA